MLMIPELEDKILKFWKEREIFQKSLELRQRSAGRRKFVFFEGPPTANNRPGIHHLIGRAFKDIFVRYKSMRGYLVERKAGWDTHGLPVEIEVEKELGLKNKKAIEAYGIDKFNAKAKESVWKYKDEWERFTERTGFWLDMHHPYITYDPDYIESLWWVIKQIDDRKLLYRGHKVLPWCPRCGTALSSHEVAQGYEDITDTSVYVKFRLKNPEKILPATSNQPPVTSILVWTTTPWTLPGNVALAVGSKISYVLVSKNGENFVLARDLVEKIVPSAEAIREMTGKDLVGLEYEPLFNVLELKSEKSYKVYPADFVTTTDGTGVVHTAVMYGEDDYKLGEKLGLPKVHTVDEEGKFRDNVPELAGLYAKDATTENAIIKHLEGHNFLFKKEPYTHSYPHCWRCHTALLYYAKDSWFVAMSKLQKQLLKNNRKINWQPEHLKDGRFGEFLREVKDWAFSRERYWGTPLPVWQCKECQEQAVIGSVADLEKQALGSGNVYCIMRHGYTARNEASPTHAIINTRLETDTYHLNEIGRAEVEQALKTLEPGGVDLIYASPFLRTRETAAVAAKLFGVQVHIDDRLVDISEGVAAEGQEVSTVTGRKTISDKPADGESWDDVRVRAMAFMEDLEAKHKGKKILIVSHQDTIWLMDSIAGGLSAKNVEANQAEINKFKPGYLQEMVWRRIPRDEHGELDLHRPYVDELILKCSKCEGQMQRAKEVVDVWFDSGAMPYAQWHYPFDFAQGKPFDSKKEFGQNFPADFITEAVDQTRGWFYTLLAVSTVLGRGAPYKNVLCYSHVLDGKGRKMSKSLGNTVDPWKVMKEFGADAARWYFYSVNSPGDNKLFAFPEAMKQPKAFLGTLSNLLNFFELYNKLGRNHLKARPRPQSLLDQWLQSRFHSTLAVVTKALDAYDPSVASRAIESFVTDDLSNWWLRRSREQFQRPKNDRSLERSISFLQLKLTELSKLLAPFAPFMAEHIYKKISSERESVHLEDWLKVRKGLINASLEQEMAQARELVTLGLAQRKNANIKVRQPLAGVTFRRSEPFAIGIENIIKGELNVKSVAYNTALAEPVQLDSNITHELQLEGYARELMRQLQDMRKEAGYRVDDKALATWHSDHPDVIAVFEQFHDEIKHTTMLKDLSRGHQENLTYDIEKEFELTSGVKVWLGIRK